MNVSKDMMIKILERDSEKEDGKTYVFFISDGEITNDDELDSFAEIAEYIDGGAVFGCGEQIVAGCRAELSVCPGAGKAFSAACEVLKKGRH